MVKVLWFNVDQQGQLTLKLDSESGVWMCNLVWQRWKDTHCHSIFTLADLYRVDFVKKQWHTLQTQVNVSLYVSKGNANITAQWWYHIVLWNILVIMNDYHGIYIVLQYTILCVWYIIYMCPWSTKPVISRWGIFVAKAKNTLYWSKW